MVFDYVNQTAPVGKLFLEKISLLPLTGGFSGAIMRSAQESRYGSPVLTPGLRQRVNMEITVPEVPALFCCDVGAISATHISFCLEVLPIANTGHQTNEDIRDKEVRLISESGEQLGIMSSQEALRLAEERSLDLVKISPNAVPPVCKLMDYGKYRFEQTKREKEARKNQRVVEIKEIRMSPGIDVNDFNVKLRNAQKFLAEGNRCKITVRFRGREMAHTNIGQDLLVKFAQECGEIAVMDKSPKLEGRHMSIFLSPKPAKDAKK